MTIKIFIFCIYVFVNCGYGEPVLNFLKSVFENSWNVNSFFLKLFNSFIFFIFILFKQILESEKALEEACGKLSSMEKRVRQLELGK